MEKITSVTQLRESIAKLEIKRNHDAYLLKEQINLTYERLKPINLIKHKINELVSSPDGNKTILNTVLGIAAGYLSKKVVVGSTHNPIKNIIGTLLQIGVSGIVAKNAGGVTSVAGDLISSFLRKRKHN